MKEGLILVFCTQLQLSNEREQSIIKILGRSTDKF
jgi:hypothetical protein